MIRIMTDEDLGDCRVFEDEAIREQAARLQVHVQNLGRRIAEQRILSEKTVSRFLNLKAATDVLYQAARKRHEHNIM